MATTLAVFNALQGCPGTGYPDTRNNHPVISLTKGDNWIFSGKMPQGYAGGTLTAVLLVAHATATTGNWGFQAEVERIAAAGQDIDSDGFDTANTGSYVAVPGTTGVMQEYTITLTNKDSLAAGENYRIRITRLSPSDTAAGEAQILSVELRE